MGDPRRRLALSARLGQLAALRRDRDPLLPPSRLPDGLRDRARAGAAARLPPPPRDPALLDELPHPRLRLDRAPAPQRHDQRGAPLARAHRGAAAAHEQRVRRRARPRLLLPSLHGAAALRDAREARRDAPRGGGGARRAAAPRAHLGAASALSARASLPLPSRLPPGGGRVRRARSSRRPRPADDRQGAVGRVLHQPRLARRLGARGLDAGAARRPARAPEARLRVMSRVLLWIGYLFLYTPIALLVLYSFNASRLVAVWGGLSTRWYGELLRNEAILGAALVSLEVAALAATLAAALGTLAGIALARWRFPGRTVFSIMATAPLVLPEVITGLSLLLLFVS